MLCIFIIELFVERMYNTMIYKNRSEGDTHPYIRSVVRCLKSNLKKEYMCYCMWHRRIVWIQPETLHRHLYVGYKWPVNNIVLSLSLLEWSCTRGRHTNI